MRLKTNILYFLFFIIKYTDTTHQKFLQFMFMSGELRELGFKCEYFLCTKARKNTYIHYNVE